MFTRKNVFLLKSSALNVNVSKLGENSNILLNYQTIPTLIQADPIIEHNEI